MVARRRSILFLTGTLGGGGSENVLLQHVRMLDRTRFRPEVLAIDPHVPGRRDYESAGIPVFGPPREGTGNAKILRFLGMLLGRCSTGSVDLVHAWITTTALIGPAAARLRSRVKVVVSQRNTGYWLRPWKRGLYRWSNHRFVDALVVNSDAGRRQLVMESLCSEDKIHVVRNGVDASRFCPARDRAESRIALGLDPDAVVVGMVGSLKSLKGPRDLLEAAARLTKEGLIFHTVLVGDGPQRAELERWARARPELSRVRFLGRRENVEAIYPTFDVCVLCSRTEGLPNVVLEAMASACPLVVTCVGGVPEAVRNGIEGVHYEPGFVSDLASALRSLLADPAERIRMGAAGRQRAVSEFGWPQMQMRLESIYELLLTGTRD